MTSSHTDHYTTKDCCQLICWRLYCYPKLYHIQFANEVGDEICMSLYHQQGPPKLTKWLQGGGDSRSSTAPRYSFFESQHHQRTD